MNSYKFNGIKFISIFREKKTYTETLPSVGIIEKNVVSLASFPTVRQHILHISLFSGAEIKAVASNEPEPASLHPDEWCGISRGEYMLEYVSRIIALMCVRKAKPQKERKPDWTPGCIVSLYIFSNIKWLSVFMNPSSMGKRHVTRCFTCGEKVERP